MVRGLTDCRNAAGDSSIHAHIVSEQSNINNSTKFYKMYPIISIGFGYKF